MSRDYRYLGTIGLKNEKPATHYLEGDEMRALRRANRDYPKSPFIVADLHDKLLRHIAEMNSEQDFLMQHQLPGQFPVFDSHMKFQKENKKQ